MLTVKPEETREWEEWAAKAGRTDDLIIFNPENNYRFDFLHYEQTREGKGAGSTFNIVDLLVTACEIAKPDDSGGGGGENQFFVDAGNELIAKTVDVLLIAGEPVTVENILELINTAPTSKKMVDSGKGRKFHEVFKATGKDSAGKPIEYYFATVFKKAKSILNSDKKKEIRDFKACHTYFFNDYATMGERMRSSVKLNVTTTLYQILRGELGLLFCGGEIDIEAGEKKLTPEITYLEEKIIILDMPVMEWKRTGTLAQGLFKFMFQRAIERRDVNKHPHPVFIWADEAQYFLRGGRTDQMFLTTARSARCTTVYLTQNIENYYSIMPESVARSMIGNLQNKLFFQNTDTTTNLYASSIIGKKWDTILTGGISLPSSHDAGNISRSKSEQQINKIEPEQFNELRTGGPHNDLIVDAVVFSGGRTWFNTDDVYDIVQFKQG